MNPKITNLKSVSSKFDIMHCKFHGNWSMDDLMWAIRRVNRVSFQTDKHAGRKIYTSRHTKYYVIFDFSETKLPKDSESFRSKDFYGDIHHPVDRSDYAFKLVIFIWPTPEHVKAFKRLQKNCFDTISDKPYLMTGSLKNARHMVDSIIAVNDISKEK